ncbi:replicative DNA helicase [Fibrobacterota bacterium]
MASESITKRNRQVNSDYKMSLPPHAIEVEREVIGGMLLGSLEAISIALEKLREDDFYSEKHRILFTTIADMDAKDIAVDMITLTDNLKKTRTLEKAGGDDYLMDIATEVVTWANIASYCEIIREKSRLRKLIHSCTTILEECRNSSHDSETILDLAESSIYDIGASQIRQEFYPIKHVLKETFELIEKYSNAEIMGVPSGYSDLDSMTGGFQKSDLIILAGRPSMGKTALSLNMITHAALRYHKSVAFFSLEMGKEQLVQRILCSEGGVSLQRLRTGKLPKREYPKLLDVAGELNKSNIFIDDSANQTSIQIRSKCRRIAHQNNGLDLVVIDYLQLMSGSGRDDSRQQEIAQISRALKGLAKELKIPVIALSQLNRSVETRADGRPLLSDLRESGALEQDADIVMFVFREEQYKNDPGLQGKAEIILAKQRNGPTGIVPLTFVKEYASFTNYSPRNPEQDGF